MIFLLTGGAGFIGSHTAVELINQGHQVIIYDNLCNSSQDVINKIRQITHTKIDFVQGDIRDVQKLTNVINRYSIEAVIHFAGLKAVGESCSKPIEYFDNNVSGTVGLLKAMSACNVKQLIFSSSATVYGIPKYLPLNETHPLSSTNPYGRTKLHIEEILKDVCESDNEWSIVCLRYFNPIGAHESGLIGENPQGIPNNLLPYVARVATGQLACLKVFGGDYDTPDGTGIRDYIHVVDLAKGHVCATQYAKKHHGWIAINLGTGNGYSVLDVVKTFEKVSHKKITYQIVDRRPGDVASNWADVSLAQKLLGWKAELSLQDMCRSSWNFQSKIKR